MLRLPSEAETEVETTTVCWDGVADGSLAQALTPPAHECIETQLLGSHRRRTRPRAKCRHLGLVLTTRSAYRHPIAKIFVDAIAERIELSNDVHERAHTALQEAVMNAVMHGNLGLGSDLRDDLNGLEQTHQNIEQLLAVPRVASGAVRVDAIWNSALLILMVRDSGAGFEKDKLPSAEQWHAAGHHGSGRGFLILEAFCDRIALLRGGTLIKLGFDL
jgi:anti-sigma regulatory factor (Ser/Thr protein kinase)